MVCNAAAATDRRGSFRGASIVYCVCWCSWGRERAVPGAVLAFAARDMASCETLQWIFEKAKRARARTQLCWPQTLLMDWISMD